MSGTTIVLTLIAAVLSVGDGSVTIGGEGVALLEPGDRGSIFYELTVGPEARRIDVGSAEVVSVDGDRAVMTMGAGEAPVQAGYSVELTVPYERARPGAGAESERAQLTRRLRAMEVEKEELILQLAASDSRQRETGEGLDQTRAELAAARRRAAELDDTVASLEGRNAELQHEIEALVFVLGKTLAESAK